MSEWDKAREVQTLKQAHEVLSGLRPGDGEPLAVWRDYYLRSSAVYARIAEIDRGHHHEALYWSGREKRKAEEIKQPQ
ncbi:AMED_5909 family protein [Prauserella cavernicola]|uniref:Uncharacterized protein n=1 Tax=Prauserella cavernicola TaxID=2800127 RepID=A0A934V4B1_9PSEU|nr:AMED_5909 family protein [Prauserella cavernicola]MBK1785232.1 hypothetical protein [Prauserella cavernicola]